MTLSALLLLKIGAIALAIPHTIERGVKSTSFPVGNWAEEQTWDKEDIPVEHDTSIFRWFSEIDVPEPWEKNEKMDHSQH
ncbi:hypothetical protein F5Y19DRAFT_471554 [Xylariaceae sp. FL1651]|nr:hypothetical protein F5Y19DRAFT_471554 [Xylariaceae sp. FL1651]